MIIIQLNQAALENVAETDVMSYIMQSNNMV